MSTWSLGSAASQIMSLIEDIPTAISGAILLDIVDRRRLYMESFTGQTIGSTGIAEQYQPALLYLSTADVLGFMNTFGVDGNSISLAEFSESKGGESNLMKSQEVYLKMGEDALKILGKGSRWQKVNG